MSLRKFAAADQTAAIQFVADMTTAGRKVEVSKQFGWYCIYVSN